MSHRQSRRRLRVLLVTFVLLLGLAPVGVATAANHHTSSRTEISFTSTPVEILVPGEETYDESGVGHFRGEVVRDEVTGDISGEAIITFNGDFVPGPSCDPANLDTCFEGEFSSWGSVVITDENGVWEGDFLMMESFFEGEEPSSFSKIILAGRGGNAGKSIVADITFPEEGDAAIFTGTLLTVGAPAFGLNMLSQTCFNPETFGLSGAFISSGAVESSGSATVDIFEEGGSEGTYRYGLFVQLTFTNDLGSMTIQLLGETQDHAETHVGWGHWLIVGGTGAYAELYGHGKVSGYGGNFPQCDSGYGVQFQFLGDAHFN